MRQLKRSIVAAEVLDGDMELIDLVTLTSQDVILCDDDQTLEDAGVMAEDEIYVVRPTLVRP